MQHQSAAAIISAALADRAEAVCAHYLSAGHRAGRYWLCGDVSNNPGKSLYVHLEPSGGRPAGRWVDTAHPGSGGDLLTLIKERFNYTSFRDAMDEARRFLAMQPSALPPAPTTGAHSADEAGEAARRLFHAGRPVARTLAERYLNSRKLTGFADARALRFHPRVFIRIDGEEKPRTFPALLAAVTNNAGEITGIIRIFLDPAGGKARIAEAKKMKGSIRGNAVRFEGGAQLRHVVAAGEGLETMLSVKAVRRDLAVHAALSTRHLQFYEPPPGCTDLVICEDNDAPGKEAADLLEERLAGRLIRIHRSRPRTWCSSHLGVVVSGISGRLCHAAMVASMMVGSSLSGAMVSRVM